MFKRGSFDSVIEQRGQEFTMLWNHNDDEPIGKTTEIRGDDVGMWFAGQLNMDLQRSRDVLSNIEKKVADGLSFQFRSNRKAETRSKAGIREIRQVEALKEIGPVTFASNDNAKVDSVRSSDFATTLEDDLNSQRGHTLMSALHVTMSDIWWGNEADRLALLDTAFSDFHAAYLEWARMMIDSGKRSAINAVSERVNELCAGNIETLASTTSLTVDELRSLKEGNCLPVESRGKLAAIDGQLETLHSELRTSKIETLISEVRSGGFSGATRNRLITLLQPEAKTGTVKAGATIEEIGKALESLSKTINGKE